MYGQFLTVYAGLYLRWLHWQRPGGLNSVCGAAASQRVADRITRLAFSSIQIRSKLAEVFVEPWLAFMENVRKMTTKRSGKSWGIYS